MGGTPPPQSTPELQARLDALLKSDRKLGQGWKTGAKLSAKATADTSGSAHDYALVWRLAVVLGVDDALIAHALRVYPWGRCKGDERQIAKLLGKAAGMRAAGGEETGRQAPG